MTQPSSAGAVVIDANILVSLCTKEPQTFSQANAAFNDYAQKGWEFYAPNVIVGEAVFIFCRKLQLGQLTEAEHADSLDFLIDYTALISMPAGGDASLLPRAEEVRSGYGCSRSADGLYIAFAEQLAVQGPAEILTLDGGFTNQVAKNAPTVRVNLLPS
jgi:predicted nucleic acid-binding protein